MTNDWRARWRLDSFYFPIVACCVGDYFVNVHVTVCVEFFHAFR